MLPNQPKLEAVHEDVLRALNGEWPFKEAGAVPSDWNRDRPMFLEGCYVYLGACAVAEADRRPPYTPREVRQACLELEFLGMLRCNQHNGTWELTSLGERWLRERDRQLRLVGRKGDL